MGADQHLPSGGSDAGSVQLPRIVPSRPSRAERGYIYRDALRLLFILVAASEPSDAGDPAFPRVFVGEKRLMAIDFLVRYPDYLADALLDFYEERRDDAALAAACAILDSHEPEVRTVAMIRWHYGAFQNIETALAVLDARRLVRSMRRNLGSGTKRFEFMVGSGSEAFLADAVASQPSLGWYAERTVLAMSVAWQRSGSDLKEAQYEYPEYRTTAYGAVIPSIKDRVLARLRTIDGSHGEG